MLERNEIMHTSIRSKTLWRARVTRGTSVRTLSRKLSEEVKEKLDPR